MLKLPLSVSNYHKNHDKKIVKINGQTLRFCSDPPLDVLLSSLEFQPLVHL